MIKERFKKRTQKMQVTFRWIDDWKVFDRRKHAFAYHQVFPNAGDYAKIVIDGKLKRLW